MLDSVLHRSLGVHRALDPVGVLPAAARRGHRGLLLPAPASQAAAGAAEGMATDVTMLVGNGCTPGHAALALALALYRRTPGVRAIIDARADR